MIKLSWENLINKSYKILQLNTYLKSINVPVPTFLSSIIMGICDCTYYLVSLTSNFNAFNALIFIVS